MSVGAITELIRNLDDSSMDFSYRNLMSNVELISYLSVYKIQCDQFKAGQKITKSIWGTPVEGQPGKITVSGTRRPTDKEYHYPGYPDWYSAANQESHIMARMSQEQCEQLGIPYTDNSEYQRTDSYSINHDELNELDNLIICYLKDWSPEVKPSGSGLIYLMNNNSTIYDIIKLVLEGKTREEIRMIQFPNAPQSTTTTISGAANVLAGAATSITTSYNI